MKKLLSVLTLAAVVLSLALVIQRRVGAGGDTSAQNIGLGLQVAGGWHAVADLGAGPFEALLGLTADGGLVMSNTSRSGGAVKLNTSFGSWKRIGVRTIAATHLILIEDPDGNLRNYEKVVSELVIDGDELSGPVVGLIYAPEQDPLDPEETPILTLTGSVTARRVLPEVLSE